jgi:putative membrane protein
MSRRISLVLGVLALAAVWLGPLPALAATSFSAHMAMHMGVVAVAAPLLALGVAGGRFDPVVRAPSLFPPVPWSIVELVVVWTWHTPVLHHAARHGLPAFAIEQASFLLSGFVVWIAAFGGGARLRAERTGAGVLALLLTSMHMTLLGALLALAPRPLFAHGHGHGALSPLDDQHLGGAIMLLVGGISYLAGGLWLGARLLRRVRARLRGDA